MIHAAKARCPRFAIILAPQKSQQAAWFAFTGLAPKTQSRSHSERDFRFEVAVSPKYALTDRRKHFYERSMAENLVYLPKTLIKHLGAFRFVQPGAFDCLSRHELQARASFPARPS